MARIPKVEMKVNLDDLFGESHRYNQATRESVGQAIIDKIIERTQANKDKEGRSLGKYSQTYADSSFGKIFGKSKGAPVNLTATGDMLGSITITNQTAKTITIGFEDPVENTKAFGHISGMEGHPFLEGKVKVRDFFGLPKSEMEKIASDFESQVKSVDAIESAQTREQLDSAILTTIGELEGELGIEPVMRALNRQRR